MLLAFVPIRLAGAIDTDQLVEQQDRAALTVDDRAWAEITRPFRSLELDNDMDVKRQRLGEPPAAIPEEVAGAETGDPDPLVHEGARREIHQENLQRTSVSSCQQCQIAKPQQEQTRASWKVVRFTSNICWTLVR